MVHVIHTRPILNYLSDYTFLYIHGDIWLYLFALVPFGDYMFQNNCFHFGFKQN